jgi:glycosyltransferase involved in cell wall biosynthesis
VATLVPSLVYETFGFITLESLAQRTPVVATELGAVGELARESGGGLTYGNEEELLAALDRLLDEPGLREELGERGHSAFLERWSVEPHIERYLSLIADARARRSDGVHRPELVTV